MLSKHCNISRDTSSNPCHTVWFHRICMSLQCPHNRNYCMLPLLLLLCRVSSLCGVLLLVGCDTHSFFKKLTDFVLAVLRTCTRVPAPMVRTASLEKETHPTPLATSSAMRSLERRPESQPWALSPYKLSQKKKKKKKKQKLVKNVLRRQQIFDYYVAPSVEIWCHACVLFC